LRGTGHGAPFFSHYHNYTHTHRKSSVSEKSFFWEPISPGYDFLKRLSRSVAGKDSDGFGAPVLVRTGNVRQMGFLMEELPDNQAAVFVPLAPAMTLGNVVVVDLSEVERLVVPATEVFNAVGTLGYGTRKVIEPHS